MPSGVRHGPLPEQAHVDRGNRPVNFRLPWCHEWFAGGVQRGEKQKSDLRVGI